MRSLRRALTAATAVSLLALSVTACSDDGSTVRFGYISDYNGASLLAIAEKQGLWEKQGLTPEIKVFTNGPLQIQALGADDLDFGYIGPGAMWLPATGKAKVVAINTLAYADRVIGRPGVTSIADLKGKKVGVPEGTSGDMVLNLALQKAGMTVKDIQKVPMDPATVVSAFVAGQIDGAASGTR
ncbi:ABC transporter substrate-binding protein [Nonomuraea thailandensis]